MPAYVIQMLPFGALFQNQGFHSFETQHFDNGVLAGSAITLFLATLAVRVGVAIYLFVAATRLKNEGRGPALFPPLLWALISLFGGAVIPLLTAFLFMAIHYSAWFKPDLAMAWSNKWRTGKSRDDDRVAKLTAELEELRRRNQDGGDESGG